MNSILVVEDELHLRESIIKYLALEGMEADGAATLGEARKHLEGGGYRVAVLDLNLPDGDGIELAGEIPETTGVVIVSARGTLDQRLEGLRTGAYAYLVKPVELPELVAIIRNITARLVDPPEQKELPLFSSAAITWKGEFSTAAPAAVEDAGSGRLELPEGRSGATGGVRLLSVGRDIFTCRVDYAPGEPKEEAFDDIALVEKRFSEEAVILTAVQSGRCRLRETGNGREHFLGPGMLLARKGGQVSDLLSPDAGNPTVLQSICIKRRLLTNLMGPEYRERLERQLGLAGEGPERVHRISKVIETLFHAGLPETVDEAEEQLPMVHSRIRTLMDRLAESLSLKNAPSRAEAQSGMLERIHQELLNPAGNAVTLDELAARFECSSKTLNEGFRKLYGQSISSFQLTRRMLAAHDELLHTDTPLKSIAAKYGYSYVNHFSTAFRKHFGRTPAAIRSQGKRTK